MKRYQIIPCLLLVPLAAGCLSQLRDDFNDTRVACFNHNVAKAAYAQGYPMYCGIDCPQSFRLGFMAGFIAMMNGSSGCPPVFPPNSKICSLAWLDDGTPEDRRNAWYDGYSHGVLSAQQTGAVDVNRMPARLPSIQQVYDPSLPSPVPPEYSPLSPTPTPVPLNGGIPGVPLDVDIPAAPLHDELPGAPATPAPDY